MIPSSLKKKILDNCRMSNIDPSRVIIIGDDLTVDGILLSKLDTTDITNTSVITDFSYEPVPQADEFPTKKFKKPHHAKKRKGWER
jgi:hypothetical protein